MPAIKWDEIGKRFWETGTDHGVLYPVDPEKGTYKEGVAWNGLTGVSEAPEGAEVTTLYADNIAYASITSAEKFKATITAYTYPDEFGPCVGEGELEKGVTIGQQDRIAFGLSYRTKIANDVTQEAGYFIHLVYGLVAAPSQKDYKTINDSPEAIEFSWEASSTPVPVPDAKPTSHIKIDSRALDKQKLKKLEDALYGADAAGGGGAPGQQDQKATLPTPDELKKLLA